MRGLTRWVFAALLGLVFVASVGVGQAHADAISGGELYGVFVQDGTFGGDGSDTYTIVRFLEFGASGPFPNALDPVAFGIPDPLNPSAPITAGSEFFLLGSLTGTGGPANPNHLLLSLNGVAPGDLPPYMPEGLHTNLIAGTNALASYAGGRLSFSMSADEFWALYAGVTATGFFSGVDAVRSLQDNSYQFEGGSEDLFGYRPHRRHKHHDDCDEDCGKKYEEDDEYPDEEHWNELDGSDFYVGTLNGSITGFSFTDPDGNVSAIPEPSTLLLLGGALGLGLGVRQRRRRKAA